MKKTPLFFIFLCLFFQLGKAQTAVNSQWYNDAKFGIFVHYGLYAQIGYTEWAQNHFEIQAADYEKLQSQFAPSQFNANQWVQLFMEAGAKYLVFTAKHHEGFSMYQSKYTDFNSFKSPYSIDFLAQLSEACLQKKGLPFGVYYSVMDWHHPDYLPRRYFDNRPKELANTNNYKLFFKNQVSEIIDRYHPSLLWFDGEWENTHDSLESVALDQMIRDKNPSILINNRLSRYVKGDFKTPENAVPATGLKNENGKPVNWELCYTINDSWGYDPYSTEFKSARGLIRLLIDICSKGGNLLLNVGPKPDGSIQSEFQERLLAMGKWLKENGNAIYGTKASIFEQLPFYGASTTKGNTIYLHAFLMPSNRQLAMPLLKNNITKVYHLASKKELPYHISNNQCIIDCNGIKIDDAATVIAVETAGLPELKSQFPLYAANQTIDLLPEAASFDPLSKKENMLVQYFDKMVLKKWNQQSSLNNIQWHFSMANTNLYDVYLKAASANELKGTISGSIQIDSTRNLLFQVPARTAYTYTNAYLYKPIYIGQISINKGFNDIKLQVRPLAGQELVFEKLLFIPHQK
jgi:alpha-L-fucosidase